MFGCSFELFSWCDKFMMFDVVRKNGEHLADIILSYNETLNWKVLLVKFFNVNLLYSYLKHVFLSCLLGLTLFINHPTPRSGNLEVFSYRNLHRKWKLFRCLIVIKVTYEVHLVRYFFYGIGWGSSFTKLGLRKKTRPSSLQKLSEK